MTIEVPEAAPVAMDRHKRSAVFGARNSVRSRNEITSSHNRSHSLKISPRLTQLTHAVGRHDHFRGRHYNRDESLHTFHPNGRLRPTSPAQTSYSLHIRC